MKRLIAAILVVAVLAVGLTAMAKPINVGGLSSTVLSPINVGGLTLTSSPINVGGLSVTTSLTPINVGGL